MELKTLASSSASNGSSLRSRWCAGTFVMNSMDLIGFPRSLSIFSLGAWVPKYGGMLVNSLNDASNASNTVKWYAIGNELMWFREMFSNFRNSNVIFFFPILFALISSINSFCCNSNACNCTGNRFNGQCFKRFAANEMCLILSGSRNSIVLKWFNDKSKISSSVNSSNAFCSIFIKSFCDR